MVNSFGASDTVPWFDELPTEVKVGIIYGARAYSDPVMPLKFSNIEITRYPYGYGATVQMLGPFKSMWELETGDPDEYVKVKYARLDTEPISNIAITADYESGRSSSWRVVNDTNIEIGLRIPYHLTFYSFANHYDVELPRVENFADLCALRLALYFYLMMNESCVANFNDVVPVWPFDSYNLQSVLRIFEEDLTNYNEDYILKQYIEKMGHYGIDFDEFHEACLKGGFMDTLMKSMQILGKDEGQKQEQKFRL